MSKHTSRVGTAQAVERRDAADLLKRTGLVARELVLADKPPNVVQCHYTFREVSTPWKNYYISGDVYLDLASRAHVVMQPPTIKEDSDD